MRIVAIYICWHDWDLLEKSVKNIRSLVDKIIVVGSEMSNFGNKSPIKWPENVVELTWEPDLSLSPHQNETEKRNYGISFAKTMDFTHFIMLDADEYYKRFDFSEAKKYMIDNPSCNGLVHPLNVLFKKPTYYLHDHTLVPGITKLLNGLKTGKHPEFPFAKDSDGNFHIDPTRQYNVKNNIKLWPTPMWHASWIRKDVNVKIENSAARNNIKRSSIYKDLENADIGVYNDFYRDTIKECENYFNL